MAMGFRWCGGVQCYPFAASNPDEIKDKVVGWDQRRDWAVRDTIVENHQYIDNLRGFDAAVVAWGAPKGPLGAETLRWAADSSRLSRLLIARALTVSVRGAWGSLRKGTQDTRHVAVRCRSTHAHSEFASDNRFAVLPPSLVYRL